jgi:hypothetical protein
MEKIWGFSPTDVDRMESERAEDQLLAARTSLNIAASAGSQVDLPPEIAGPPTPPALPPAPPKAPEPAPAAPPAGR